MSSSGEVREQIHAGQLRVLAVTSAGRVPGVDAPTLRAAGIENTRVGGLLQRLGLAVA